MQSFEPELEAFETLSRAALPGLTPSERARRGRALRCHPLSLRPPVAGPTYDELQETLTAIESALTDDNEVVINDTFIVVRADDGARWFYHRDTREIGKIENADIPLLETMSPVETRMFRRRLMHATLPPQDRANVRLGLTRQRHAK
jgi:hypothetical protein